ncbi:hypothetical protein B0T26DRAFT_741504 [Lasiosphaeria miniovina]|uniref:Uncharacterized protein n=1 Tax=Lasiosphaeria miniovina TaxID=1954250 RepID=A0AA40AML7_9PEZI|nr:uncharacterized protein B0T26DRAFT_741504 [Lasiosphaeria miniovina]KAK0718633.1 hypothetical protein B0T26DRAFT_741504 [Lasiosphaeria miniovina]
MSSTSHVDDIERDAGVGVRAVPLVARNMPDNGTRARQGCFLCLEKIIYDKVMPWECAIESDSAIYRRLVDTCYQYLGRWKRWLPYYGITAVVEVNFHFSGIAESNGSYPIWMDPVKPDHVLKECEKIIARNPTGDTSDCFIGIEEWSQPCILVEVEKAEQRRKQLLFLSHLKDCARDPARANGLHTLEGLAQDTCIYETK